VWILIVILIGIFFFHGWLIFSPLELLIDTRIPRASFRWVSIGKAMIVYEQDKWLLKISVWFFSKQWELEELLFRERKKKRVRKVKPNGKTAKTKWLRKIPRLLKTFQVTQWRIAIDTGDDLKNAWLYPLNFYPSTSQHLFINFSGDNYLFVKIRNAAWKLGLAFLK
jgi:hypothetical protein